eukprot:562883-Rhodomonas_salina.1
MRWGPLAAAKATAGAVERARTYLNPEVLKRHAVSKDGMVTCELVSPGPSSLSPHTPAQQGRESKPLRWQDKEHHRARGPLVGMNPWKCTACSNVTQRKFHPKRAHGSERELWGETRRGPPRPDSKAKRNAAPT